MAADRFMGHKNFFHNTQKINLKMKEKGRIKYRENDDFIVGERLCFMQKLILKNEKIETRAMKLMESL